MKLHGCVICESPVPDEHVDELHGEIKTPICEKTQCHRLLKTLTFLVTRPHLSVQERKTRAYVGWEIASLRLRVFEETDDYNPEEPDNILHKTFKRERDFWRDQRDTVGLLEDP